MAVYTLHMQSPKRITSMKQEMLVRVSPLPFTSLLLTLFSCLLGMSFLAHKNGGPERQYGPSTNTRQKKQKEKRKKMCSVVLMSPVPGSKLPCSPTRQSE